MKYKICIFTGSRSEYGILKPLMEEIRNDQYLQLQLLVSGAHLSPEFGMTYKVIEDDGFQIDEKVELLISSDSALGVSKSLGIGVIGIADALTRLSPKILIILGDRYEAFAAATAATVLKIPIAHIHGGEVTIGSIDEAFRHSITKMSHLHFTSTREYSRRVIQLGEEPRRVFNVGALGVENIKRMQFLSREEMSRELNIPSSKPFIISTFHPPTAGQIPADKQFNELLSALQSFPEVFILLTKSNADTHGRLINQMIDEFVYKYKDRAIAFTSLGQKRYLSAMRYSSLIIGNSSSGIVESPCFKVPCINIGDRQRGRVQADNIINCPSIKNEIVGAIQKALSPVFFKNLKDMQNPYEGANTAKQIKKILNTTDATNLRIKQFFDLKGDLETKISLY